MFVSLRVVKVMCFHRNLVVEVLQMRCFYHKEALLNLRFHQVDALSTRRFHRIS